MLERGSALNHTPAPAKTQDLATPSACKCHTLQHHQRPKTPRVPFLSTVREEEVGAAGGAKAGHLDLSHPGPLQVAAIGFRQVKGGPLCALACAQQPLRLVERFVGGADDRFPHLIAAGAD